MFSRHAKQITCTLLLAACPTFADTYEVGNGGRGIVCHKSTGGKTVELLDLYESRVLRGMQVEPGLKETDPFALAKKRLERLATVDPASGKLLLGSLIKLQRDLSFEETLKLVPIDDSKHSFEPADKACRSEQMAVLRKTPLPGEKRVLINKRLWDLLPMTHKTGLVLHELWYERLAFLGEKDSVHTRYIVSYLMSAEFTRSTADYWKIIKKMKVPIYKSYR
jgi:hypothetical protein